MIFHNNDLIIEIMKKHFDTWKCAKDTKSFVPKNCLGFIDKIIFNNLKSKIKEIEIYNLMYLSLLGYKLSFWERMKIKMSKLEPLFRYEYLLDIEQNKKPTEKATTVINEKPDKELENEALCGEWQVLINDIDDKEIYRIGRLIDKSKELDADNVEYFNEDMYDTIEEAENVLLCIQEMDEQLKQKEGDG